MVLGIRGWYSRSMIAGEHHPCLLAHCSYWLGVLGRHTVVVSDDLHILLRQSITGAERIGISLGKQLGWWQVSWSQLVVLTITVSGSLSLELA